MSRPKLPTTVLTPRERELLPLFARGLTVKEVGQSVNIATTTAQVHLYNTMRKLGVHHARDLAAHVTTGEPSIPAADQPPWET